MKKITQKEFDNLPITKGYKECPSYTDYTNINSFGERCSFGVDCSFEGLSEYIGRYPFFSFVGIGSRTGSKTYVFNLKSGVYIRCGCFLGTKDDFLRKVDTENADLFYKKQIELIIDKFNHENNNQQKG